MPIKKGIIVMGTMNLKRGVGGGTTSFPPPPNTTHRPSSPLHLPLNPVLCYKKNLGPPTATSSPLHRPSSPHLGPTHLPPSNTGDGVFGWDKGVGQQAVPPPAPQHHLPPPPQCHPPRPRRRTHYSQVTFPPLHPTPKTTLKSPYVQHYRWN